MTTSPSFTVTYVSSYKVWRRIVGLIFDWPTKWSLSIEKTALSSAYVANESHGWVVGSIVCILISHNGVLSLFLQSRNWDGGQQEMNTAGECVRSIFPDAAIQNNRTENYPIRVIITADVGGKPVEIWSGRQQDLFRKYAAKRSKALEQMKKSLLDLKANL
jgi:hypothetical protein